MLEFAVRPTYVSLRNPTLERNSLEIALNTRIAKFTSANRKDDQSDTTVFRRRMAKAVQSDRHVRQRDETLLNREQSSGR
jgi:hypothetical protein